MSWIQNLIHQPKKNKKQQTQTTYSEPFFDASTPYTECSLLSIDIETNGLDAKSNEILSIGVVPIESAEIRLSQAHHWLIQSDYQGGDTVTIHGIRDLDRKLDGITLPQAMKNLRSMTKDRILLFHHSDLDLSFLNIGAKKVGETWFSRELLHPRKKALFGFELGLERPTIPPVVDTLYLEHRRLTHSKDVITPSSLKLSAIRERYGLPSAPVHNALEDAVATAELALAMFSAISGRKPCPIGYFLSRPYFT